ncbi:MAG: Wadjet anti-phage system protein JetD domain-containing protein [Bacillota bacterium]
MELSLLQKEVLNRLLDKYENRKDYSDTAGSTRRTMLRVDARQFPEYFHVSDSSYRRMLNQEMELLERRGWITLEWERFDRGHTLRRLVLVEDAIPGIYGALARRPKSETYRQLRTLLHRWWRQAPPEMGTFYKEMFRRLSDLEPLPAPLRADHPEMIEDLLRGLHAFFEPREGEVTKRSLSVQLYGDSKRWAELEKPILQIIRSYCLTGEDDIAGDTLMGERGIVDNPTYIQIAGPLVFTTPRGRVDLCCFYPDLGLAAEMVNRIEVESCSASAVVTVENKTSYYHYLRQGPQEHLTVYLGGYHNRARRELLRKIHAYLATRSRRVPFYHWGDMDLGGLRIWRDLCDKTGISFEPLYMDERSYLSHLHLGQPFSESYGRKLAALLGDPSYECFHGLIRLMLDRGIRVEQEAVTVLPWSGNCFM